MLERVGGYGVVGSCHDGGTLASTPAVTILGELDVDIIYIIYNTINILSWSRERRKHM